MFEYIFGELTVKKIDYVALDINGLAYKIFISLKTFETLGEVGQDEKLYTHTHVKEDDISSRYFVRYITPDKQLRVISANKRDETASVFLSNGKEQTITFTAKSGYPMYLCVNGVGPRGSSIKATISAVSEDGFTIVKPLTVNEHQNEEGIDKIKGPFCGYIILP